ncbi:unnamed protein product [Urochloa decumbens]|uniref:Uncharacterized protein n=1 Tax=Urochloa decumbens TaxID=240449 RepID=A0ABC9BT78_9POAL
MSTKSKDTALLCTSEAYMSTYKFKIAGYSLTRGIGVGNFIRSATFTIGGHDWSIRFYPDGIDETSQDSVSTSLEMMSSNADVRARYHLRFVAHGTVPINVLKQVPMAQCAEVIRWFRSWDATRFGQQKACILRSLLEPGSYLVNDALTIQCDLTVVSKLQWFENKEEYGVEVPPCDMMGHFGKLLEEKVGSDVTFLVGGDTFEAHKIVLAVRSPVFKAQFFGPMRDPVACRVTVEDMQPAVFEALLHFIYNDSLPDIGDLEGKDYGEMLRHLLVAADRYAMDRLKVVCQRTICKYLDVENVASTLALAEQHECDRLRDACVEFIASSKKMNDVKATQGYADLRRTCPPVFVDLFERATKFHKT